MRRSGEWLKILDYKNVNKPFDMPALVFAGGALMQKDQANCSHSIPSCDDFGYHGSGFAELECSLYSF